MECRVLIISTKTEKPVEINVDCEDTAVEITTLALNDQRTLEVRITRRY